MTKTLREYSIVLFGTGFSRSVAFVNSIIIARLLGSEDFGKFSIFYVVMVITWILPQSFDVVFVRYAKTAKDNGEKAELLKISLFLKLLYGGAVLFLSYPVSYIVAHYAFQKPETVALLMSAMLSGVFQSFLMTIASIFQERGNLVVFSFLYSIYTMAILMLLLLAQALPFAFSLNTVVLIYLFVSLGTGLLSIFLLFMKKISHLFPLDQATLQKSLSLGKWILGVEILSYLFTRIDFLFLGRFSNFNSLGVYSIAQQIIMLVSVMMGSLSGVIMPKAAVALKSKDAYAVFKKEALLISCLINSVVIVLIIFAPAVIRMLYGAQYADASLVTRILLVGWFVNIFYLPFSSLFYTLNDSRTRFFIELAALFIATVMLYCFIPVMNIAGAALAITTTLILNAVVSTWILKSKIRFESI